MKINCDWSEWREARERLGLQPNDEKFNKKTVDSFANETITEEERKISADLTQGIEVEESDFKNEVENINGFLVYKNNFILVYIRDNTYKKKNIAMIKENPDEASKFHIYWCKTIRKMDSIRRFKNRYVMTTMDDGLFPIETNDEHGIDVGTYMAKLNVCRYCLDEAKYHGYDRGLPAIQREKHVADFNIKEFFEEVGNLARYKKVPTKTADIKATSYYSKDNAEIAKNLKEKKQYKCEDCKVLLEGVGHRQYLHMHHLNLDKTDNNPYNLKILCVDCHMNGYHADTDWGESHASEIAACRKIKREQGKA